MGKTKSVIDNALNINDIINNDKIAIMWMSKEDNKTVSIIQDLTVLDVNKDSGDIIIKFNNDDKKLIDDKLIFSAELLNLILVDNKPLEGPDSICFVVWNRLLDFLIKDYKLHIKE